MELEDKKLMAEWMGWYVCLGIPNVKGHNLTVYDVDADMISRGCNPFNWNHWNPDTDRNCWPEIFKRLRELKLFRDYMAQLSLWLSRRYDSEMDEWQYWDMMEQAHTAPPEICCKALLEVLKGCE